MYIEYSHHNYKQLAANVGFNVLTKPIYVLTFRLVWYEETVEKPLTLKSSKHQEDENNQATTIIWSVGRSVSLPPVGWLLSSDSYAKEKKTIKLLNRKKNKNKTIPFYFNLRAHLCWFWSQNPSVVRFVPTIYLNGCNDDTYADDDDDDDDDDDNDDDRDAATAQHSKHLHYGIVTLPAQYVPKCMHSKAPGRGWQRFAILVLQDTFLDCSHVIFIFNYIFRGIQNSNNNNYFRRNNN
uniref:Uncharacterized protein n=1 Tax=Glossina brevipalpis TaxID=37001 RepID=A0A1A9W5Z5_9MUSC